MPLQLYPLTFDPIYKDYVWGGERIGAMYQRNLPPGIRAESWEIACRPEGMSHVNAGSLAGVTLEELMQRAGARLAGTAVGPGPFPLIVKILDVAQRISLQVHPRVDDPRAEGEAKTELWYALTGMGESRVFAGLKPGTTRAAFVEALQAKRIESVLQSFPVRSGDAFYIPGGRVHAADAGCLLLEVQLNSNTTFRLYDWDRRTPLGEARPLHLDQGLRATNWEDTQSARIVPRLLGHEEGVERWGIVSCPHFQVERVRLSGAWSCPADPRSFRILFVLTGRLSVQSGSAEVRLRVGQTCLLPATLDTRLRPAEDSGDPDSDRTELLVITR
jgi:mannose-6-phosphate isomerase